MKRKWIIAILCGVVLLVGTGTGLFFGIRNNRAIDTDLLSVNAEKASRQPLEEESVNAAAEFSINLFEATHQNEENTFISPLSVYFALGLTANGADTNTLEQLETLLGGKPGTLDSVNNTCRTLMEDLSSEEDGKTVLLANSVWFRKDNLTVYDDFLEANAAYYGAQIYQADYRDAEAAAKDMNNWVKDHTNGMINEIITPDEITEILMLNLYNTIYFNCKWQEEISERQVYDDVFTNRNGTETSLSFLHGSGTYLKEEGLYTGFRMQYQGNAAFVGLLPAKGMTPEELAEKLTGADLRNLAYSNDGEARAAFPEWKMEGDADFKEPLQKLGLKNFFEGTYPDLSRMAQCALAPLEVSKVLQRTVLEVNREGAEAAGVTRVDIVSSAADSRNDGPIFITLNRPFLFLIQDTYTGLPLFIGIVNSLDS